MKIEYKFVTGTVEVEVPDEWGTVLIDLDRQEYNNDHKETRRHCSLEAYNLDDGLLPSNEDVVRDILAAEERWHLYEAIGKLEPRQQKLIRQVYFEGRTFTSIAQEEGVDRTAVSKATKDDDFDVEAELKAPVITKAGDVWTLGRHRLVCGDSTKAETFALLMGDRKANLVITDPPYNVNYEGSAGKIKNDNMADDAFYQFLLAAFQNTETVMADDASIYVFHADTEGLNFRRAFADAGFKLSGTCIWKKQSLVLGRSPYQWQHEPVLFGWKKAGKHQWYTGRKESTIWEFDKPKKNGDHPTMKPIPLLAYPIMNSSMSNTLVLDPFGGSGSTLIACEQTERSCCTIELDEKFCDVIVKRYIEQASSADGVSVQRDGLAYRYDELVGEEGR